MQSAPIASTEVQRLQVLQQYEILDTLPEEEYDRITRLASIICGTPIALISLIDENRQWFKSKVGIDASETHRDLAFCAHAILAPDELFIINDTLKDKRFFDNPLVTSAPNIRFYAGCPLKVSTGEPLGTLCIIDTVPRMLTGEQKEALKILGSQVVSSIELRMHKNNLLALTAKLNASNEIQSKFIRERITAENKFQEINEFYQHIVESNPDLVFVKDAEFRFVKANKALLSAFPEHLRNTIIGTTALEKFTKEEADSYLENDRRAFKEGSSEAIEHATFSEGQTRTLFTKKVRFYNAAGEPFILGISRDITDMKMAENALRKSMALNNAILSSAAHMIIATDVEGNVIVFNAEAERQLGYTAQEIVNKQTPSLWHKKDEMQTRAKELHKELGLSEDLGFRVFNSKVLTHGSEEYEWTFVRKDRSTFRGHLTSTALKDKDQKVVGFLGIIQDLTEQNRVLKELRISEERLHLASSGTSDGLWDWNILNGDNYFSPRFEAMLGYASGELTPHIDTLKAHLHPADQEQTFVAIQKHFIDRAPYDIEYRLRHKAGHYLWINVRGQASWNENDIPVRMTGFATDITRRKEIEEAMRLEKMESTRLLAMIQNAPDFIGMADTHGNLQYHNRAAKLMAGLPENQDMSQLKISDMHPPWAIKLIVEQAIPAVYEKGVWRGETAILHRDGHEIPVSQVLTLYRDDQGNPVCMTTIMQDITERKRLETLKNEFISTVSHELRTPLTSIRGSLGLMRAGVVGALPDKAKEMTDIAYNNADRLILIINDILDIEKIESGEMRFDIHGYDLSNLVGQAVEANLSYAEKYNVRFIVAPLESPVRISVDANRFIQVLSNLLSNAAKFSAAEGEIHIAFARHDDYIRISISDTGSGIPEAFHARIFSKFAQADSSSSRHKGGSGLGLNISKQIIEKMQGRINFVSDAGKGTTFWIELPELTCHSSFHQPAPNHEVMEYSEEDNNADLPRVLHAEDDYDFCRIIAHSLQGKAVVHVASTISDAADMLKTYKYELLILDLELPDGSGLTLLKQIEVQKIPIQVMILSASEVNDQVRKNVALALVKSRVSEDKLVRHILSLIENGTELLKKH